MGGKNKKLDEFGYADLSDSGALNIERDTYLDIKFYSIDKDLKTNEIIKGLKEGKNLLFIDMKDIIDDAGYIRLFVNKLKRISDSYSVTMKMYGKNWLIILPENVTFHVGDE
jgi:SepF-like predicted cell division protein (DUF552 family)